MAEREKWERKGTRRAS